MDNFTPRNQQSDPISQRASQIQIQKKLIQNEIELDEQQFVQIQQNENEQTQPQQRKKKTLNPIDSSYALQKMRFKEQVNAVKQLSGSYRYKHLTQEDFELIGDKSHDYQIHIEGSQFNSGRVYKSHKLNGQLPLYIIDPDGAINSFLCLLFGMMGYIKFIIAPLTFCFPQMCREASDCNTLYLIDCLALFVFSIKILSGFFIANIRKNTLIQNYSEIRFNYLTQELLFDLLPIIEILVNFRVRYNLLGIIYLFRILSVSNFIVQFCNFFHLEEKYIAIYHISRLVILIFSVAHYNALSFYYISQTGNDQFTWINQQNLENSNWDDIYERSLYFIIITMITVGFGDITPVTSRQRLYVIVMTLFSCFLFGYAVNTVGALFQQRDFQDTDLKQKKFQIANYLNNRSVEPEICRRVLREIEYINQMERDGLFDDHIDVILDQVSKELQQQVQENISLQILRSCQMINNILSIQCLTQYTRKMKEKTLTPGEVLFQKGARENTIYFINQGQIQIYIQNDEKREEIILRRIQVFNYEFYVSKIPLNQEKSYLGEMSFLSTEPRETSARSVGVTHVIYFQYEDLQPILVNYPDDFVHLNFLAFSKISFFFAFFQSSSLSSTGINMYEKRLNSIQYWADRKLIEMLYMLKDWTYNNWVSKDNIIIRQRFHMEEIFAPFTYQTTQESRFKEERLRKAIQNLPKSQYYKRRINKISETLDQFVC